MPKRISLLLVEDEINIGATLKDMLSDKRYAVTWAKTKADALEEIAAQPFQIALLDIQLPDGSGYEIASLLQTRSPGTAMIFLTAMSEPEHRVKGLSLGAEDYIVKPFHFEELLLRIRNAVKRAHYAGAATDATRIGGAEIDFTRFVATSGGKAQTLGTKEAKLLQLLISRRGKVVSRDEILNHVWPRETYPTARTVDNFVLKLRKLIEPDPQAPRFIKSIRGVGYQLMEE